MECREQKFGFGQQCTLAKGLKKFGENGVRSTEEFAVHKKGKEVVHVEIPHALCKMLEAALLWCNEFRADLEEEGGLTFNHMTKRPQGIKSMTFRNVIMSRE